MRNECRLIETPRTIVHHPNRTFPTIVQTQDLAMEIRSANLLAFHKSLSTEMDPTTTPKIVGKTKTNVIFAKPPTLHNAVKYNIWGKSLFKCYAV